jgi:hypothetical protein
MFAAAPQVHVRFGSRRCLAAAVLVVSLLATAPATASASWYLSRSQAARVTRHLARGAAQGSAGELGTRCWPSFRKHTQHNARLAWRMWDCGWTMRVTKTDGSVADCAGKQRIIGARRGSTHRTLRASACTLVTGPTPAPPSGASRQQQMIEQAVTFGIQRANELIDYGSFGGGFFYYGQMNRSECVVLNATRVRCPLYMWWEAHDQDTNFYPHTTRDIFQSFVFVEDLGTSVGFNTLVEPDGILSYDFNRPYYMLCSDYYAGRQPCPGNRFPVQYPPVGPPFPVS